MTRCNVLDLVRQRAVAPEMTSGDWDLGDAGVMSEVKGLKGCQRVLKGFQRVAREGVECRGSVSARVSSDRG